MARAATIYGDAVIDGALTLTGTFTAPAASITNAMVSAGIDASKLDFNRNVPAHAAGAATTGIIQAYRVPTAGTIVNFWAGCVTIPTGSATVTVDLKKNGTTVLSAVLTLNSSSVAYTATAATVTSTSVAANDVLTVELTVTTPGTDVTASDVYASIGVDEEYPV